MSVGGVLFLSYLIISYIAGALILSLIHIQMCIRDRAKYGMFVRMALIMKLLGIKEVQNDLEEVAID